LRIMQWKGYYRASWGANRGGRKRGIDICIKQVRVIQIGASKRVLIVRIRRIIALKIRVFPSLLNSLQIRVII